MKESSSAIGVVDAYLDRLALDREPPSIDALRRLHRAHAERIPYETFWIPLNEGWSVNTNDALRRIAFGQRGGYCFHLNGAFHHLLIALGYDAQRHVGTVSGPNGPTPDEVANHLALTVRDVPSADGTTHGLCWYVDLGLGDGLYEPMPLRAGDHWQAPMNFTLSELGDDRWRLNHDPELGAFTGMAFSTEPTEMSSVRGDVQRMPTSPSARC